jgi:hypothetical protein
MDEGDQESIDMWEARKSELENELERRRRNN